MSCIYALSLQHLDKCYCTNKSRTSLFNVGEIKSSSFDADIPPYDEDPPGDDDVVSDTGDDVGDDKDEDGDGDDMYGDLGGEEGNEEDGENDDNDENGTTSATIDADGTDLLIDSTGIYSTSFCSFISI